MKHQVCIIHIIRLLNYWIFIIVNDAHESTEIVRHDDNHVTNYATC